MKQIQILSFIDQEISRSGRPPTYREIAQHFGYAAVGTVQDHIQALKKKGYLEHEPGIACGLRPAHRVEPVSIPILGSVPAGKPIEELENASGFLAIGSGSLKSRNDLYALRVKGDSMIEAGILDGDFVVVKKQSSAESGEIVVALIDGEATVKTLEKRVGRVRLLPANPRYAPIELEPGRENLIQGKVISVQRYL